MNLLFSGVMNLNEENIRELKAYSEEKEVFQNHRIRVRGKANMTLLPDFFLVEVYNPDELDIAAVERAGTLSINAKDGAVLCSGEIEDIYIRTEGANQVYAISLSDGGSFWETKITKSVGPGVYFSATIRQILEKASMGSYLAKDERFVRPQTFCGRLADFISDIAKGVHARAFVSNNVLHVVEKGRSEIVMTIQEEDMIDEPDNATGVCIVRTEVKSWPVGAIISFRGKSYRLASQEISADNSQGKWETKLVLADEDYLDADGMDGG